MAPSYMATSSVGYNTFGSKKTDARLPLSDLANQGKFVLGNLESLFNLPFVQALLHRSNISVRRVEDGELVADDGLCALAVDGVIREGREPS